MGGLFRLLMQVRLLLVAVTVLLLIGTPVDIGSALAIAAAAFTSWLAAHYWQRIMDRVLHHPIWLALDVVLAFAVLELSSPLGPFFLFTVVTSAVAGLLFRWPGLVYFCSLQVLCYFAALAITPAEDAWTFQALIGQPAYYPLVAFVGIRIRRLLDEQAAMVDAQRRAEVHAAAADERTRLARELHDSLAKTLRGIAMSATALPMWVDRSPQRAADEATQIASAAEIGSREARELVANMRTPEIDQPLATLIRSVAEEWADQTGIAVRTKVSDDVDLDLLGRHEAVAILKEALTNVERHADATHVDVAFTPEDGQGTLEIRDDGAGFDSGKGAYHPRRGGHYGLVGMHERAERADGSVTVMSTPGIGTRIRAQFPLRPENSQVRATQGQGGDSEAPEVAAGLEAT